MSFWKTFGFHTVSQIDTLLEGEFTLEQLLDEEEILQETKSQNKKLIGFLTIQDTLRKLLFYITKEPVDGSDNKRRLKYPLLSCEILSSEVFAIFDAFYQPDNRVLLDDLYGFLEQDAPLNPLLASYTSRVAAVLFQKKPAETMLYLKEKDHIIPQFIKHLGNASIMDLLLKIIGHDDAAENATTLEWLCKSQFISSLVHKFEPSLPVEVLENASQALVDIISVSANSTNSPLIAQLESEELLQVLFNYMLSSGLNQPLLHGVTVLIELLRRHRRERNDDLAQLEELATPLKLTLANLDKFLALLNQPSDATVTLPGVGTIPPLGFHKLKIVDLFSMLVHSNFKCIDDELVKKNVISTLLDLFFSYHWNNFLHSTVEHMIQFILQGQNEDLKVKLLTDCNLLGRISAASRGNDEDCSKPKGLRRGYMGFLTLISQSIINLGPSNPAVEQILANDEQWQKYVKGALAAVREKESRTLGGYAPNEFHDEDLDDDFEQGAQDFMNKRNFSLDDDDDDADEVDHLEDDDDDDDDDDNEDSDDDSDEGAELAAQVQEKMQASPTTDPDDDELEIPPMRTASSPAAPVEAAAQPPTPVVLDFAQFDAFLEPMDTSKPEQPPTQ
eukprot:TRINITY_DN4912_c0_g1_i2.p1 TRINITY_DN4912_c0_g1~~TRINITY_DN4912_c0_g1_i2.p1  ORF type:complete len:617 (+),score=181.07 TRINITY_DN4912_c0_g1_i2:149-1999(+)